MVSLWIGSTAEEVPLQVEKTSLEALMNHIGVLVKLLIKFAKKLEDFTALPQSAQVTLLKGRKIQLHIYCMLLIIKYIQNMRWMLSYNYASFTS